VRVLLDESLPRRLARHLGDIEVATVFDRGWTGLKNGELLTQASADFTVFVTADQNLRYQQNLKGFDIGVVVLAAPFAAARVSVDGLGLLGLHLAARPSMVVLSRNPKSLESSSTDRTLHPSSWPEEGRFPVRPGAECSKRG